ncbi:thiamine phosphate synthase [bacterium]|nr:thiamine phosphate synthase [bacterium]
MPIEGLYVILDGSKLAEEVLKGGCKILQLRNKTATTLQLFREAQIIRELTKKYDATFIVNDRIDIALAVDADGVHLGKEDLPLSVARRLLPGKIIGFSADTLDEAWEAERLGADYISLGPIFPTQSKPDAGPVVGLETLAKVKRNLSRPLVAIGGINKYNIIETVKHGADAIAVISAVVSSPNPRQEVEQLIALFKRAKEEMNESKD